MDAAQDVRNEDAMENSVDVNRGRDLTQTLVERFDQALESDGKKAYETWGLALFHSVPDARAQEQLSGAFGLKPRDALDHYNQGCVLVEKGKMADAAKAFARSAEFDPKFYEAQYNLALALENSGEKAKAVAAWKKAAELASDDEEAAEIRSHMKEIA